MDGSTLSSSVPMADSFVWQVGQVRQFIPLASFFRRNMKHMAVCMELPRPNNDHEGACWSAVAQ
eukprot:1150229-Pelagomonas_calceolata.AAC.5